MIRSESGNMLKHVCPSCNQNISPRKERLTRGLAHDLVIFAKYIKATGNTQVHLQDDLNLTKNQYNNFQKLKYHSLVRKAQESGCWSLTQLGLSFLRGETCLPIWVSVFNNTIQELSNEYVYIHEVLNMSEFPYYEKKESVEYTRSASRYMQIL